MFETGRLDQVMTERERYNIDILGLSETRWNQSGEFLTRSGDTLLYAGHENENSPHTAGVALLLSRTAKQSLISWQAISERLITARFKCRVRNVTIIQCYAPTEAANVEDKDDFYAQLESTFDQVARKDVIIVMGDFNAQIGQNNEDREKVMGREGLGTETDNGSRFIEFCSSAELVIGGSIFPHRRIHKVTWVSPNGKTENQIDHFAISRKWRKSLRDVRNKRGADVGSDHHLLLAELQMKISKTLTKSTPRRKKWEISKLQDTDTTKTFYQTLKDKFEVHDDEGDVNNQWQQVQEAFNTTSEEVLGGRNPQKKEWISNNSWNQVLERRALKAKINECKEEDQKQRLVQAYNTANREVKRSLRKDKRRWTEDLANQAEQAAAMGKSAELYKITKQLSNKRIVTAKPVKSKNGELLTNVEDQLERWKEHFQTVLNRPSESGAEEDRNEPSGTCLRVNTEPPSHSEIVRAIKELRNGKAGGMDNIPPEVLKADAQQSADLLLPIFRKIWEKEQMPDEWKKGLLIKLPKKGDLANCENWRGIMLLSVPSKVFSRIILNRMKEAIDQKTRKEQAGFRRNRSCTDQINTLRIIVEQSVEFRSPLYLLFVDFEKAFDSINRERLWAVMKARGVPEKIIRLVQETYRDFRCHVDHMGRTSDPFEINSGVKQGCLLSPMLFLLILDEVMERVVQNKKRGIQWGMHERLEDLDFADDICLLSHSLREIKTKLDDLQEHSHEIGLKINPRKTKNLRINNKSEEALMLGEEDIEKVSSFCYLGSIISEDGGTTEDIRCRIKKATAAFAQLRPIWKNKQISRKTKLRIFQSNVKSVLLYGCETWSSTKTMTRKLQTFINRCLRTIIGIRWPRVISNEELWKITKQAPVVLTIKDRKWRWIGHTLRKEENDVTRRALDWNPQGSRRRGRPRETWRRTVEREIAEEGMSWTQIKRLANNRVRWKKFVAALCSYKE